MNSPLLSIILPTFNESGNIFPMVAAIRETFEPLGITYEIIYVDDSNDHTPERVREVMQEDDRVHLIHREGAERTGLATAFVAGCKQARGTYACCMDADLQHPPALLPKLLDKFVDGHVDLVIASRFLNGGGDRGLNELHRKFFTKGLALMVWTVLPVTRKSTDPMTGCFMFRRAAVEDRLDTFAPLGFKILMETMVRVPELTVAEVPLKFQERHSGETKASFKQGIELFIHVLRLAISMPRAALLTWVSVIAALLLVPATIALVLAFEPTAYVAAYVLGGILGACILSLPVVVALAALTLRWMRSHATLGKLFRIPSALQATKLRTRFALPSFGVMLRRVRILALLAVIGYGVYVLYGLSDGVLSDTILTIALLQLAQGMFAMYILTYAWEDPAHIKRNSSPTTYANPTRSFTALLPCVNEADVVGDTMRSIASINYPTDKKELLVVLRDDDPETVAAAEAAKSTLPPEADARIVLISGEPRNKPHHLNVGLKEAKNDIVCIFDAEDEPHPEIYNIVNTTYQEKQCDVVQSGVQLMNFDSNWYSLYNCLEYFLWFRSALHYFARQGIIPLGGNTVFFKRDWLNKVGGWDLACLTEDADIGIRLSSAGAKTAVIYDPEHATREETPPSVASFVKQRTRWNQGFLQIIRKHRWGRGSALSPKQQALALSVLAWPILYSIMLILVPFVMASAFFLNVHPIVGLVTNLPALLLVAFLLLQVIALQDFARIYSLKLTLRRIGMALLWFVPYLLVLEYSAFRAVARHLTSRNDWEKTEHIGAHRAMVAAGAES